MIRHGNQSTGLAQLSSSQAPKMPTFLRLPQLVLPGCSKSSWRGGGRLVAFLRATGSVSQYYRNTFVSSEMIAVGRSMHDRTQPCEKYPSCDCPFFGLRMRPGLTTAFLRIPLPLYQLHQAGSVLQWSAIVKLSFGNSH